MQLYIRSGLLRLVILISLIGYMLEQSPAVYLSAMMAVLVGSSTGHYGTTKAEGAICSLAMRPLKTVGMVRLRV